MKIINSLSLLITLLFLVGGNALASDLEKEKRWADQVVEAILDGEDVWLNDGVSDFLSIYTESEESSERAVIVMHGTGVHPDWPQVVQPLRVGLTENGWHTLSIQMPVLANEASHADYAPLYVEVAPRIDASIRYLKAKGIKTIVLLGHSQGAAMTAYYLSITKQKVAGFVAIGMSSSDVSVPMNSANSLRSIKIPVLDLYGDDDLEEVISGAPERVSAALKAGNKNYKQRQIAGSHFFDGEEDALLETVKGWLDNDL